MNWPNIDYDVFNKLADENISREMVEDVVETYVSLLEIKESRARLEDGHKIDPLKDAKGTDTSFYT